MRTPNYSVSQKIGNLGKRVFVGGHPDSWVQESEPVQGGDFGFDVSMWLEMLGQINGRFAVQLKSGAGAAFVGSDEKFIPVRLSPEVCNLYLQDGQPVLLVFVALQDEASTDNADMYYVWIEEELRERLKGRQAFDESDPDSMTFRIPIANRLTKSLDISGHLEVYWNHTRIANRLRSIEGTAALGTVSSLSPKGISALTELNPQSLDRWLANESMAGSSDNLWPTPRTGSAVSKIKQVADALNHSNALEADRLIAELNGENLSEPDLLAELRYQEGRRAFLEGEARAALDRFAEASALQPGAARYCAAELEAAVAANVGSTPRVPQDLLARAASLTDDEEIRFQLMRVSALEQDYIRAEELIAGLDEPNKVKAQTLYSAIRDEWPAALASADRGLAESPNSRTKKFLKILRLRALLNIVTGGNSNICVGGRPDLKAVDAIALRDATLESLREAQASGWPTNSEMILDCASAVCVTFGADRELLDLVADFAQKRPKLKDAQDALARIATFIDEPAIAISALRKIKEPDVTDLAKLVLVLSESGSHADAVDVAITHLLEKEHETLVDMAAVAAAISAYRLGSTAEESRLRNFVSEGSFAARSLLRFLSNALKHPDKREDNLERLWKDSMEGSGDDTLQDNLFNYLRPDRDDDIDKILELSKITAARRNLTEMEAAKCAAALLRRERFEEIIDFTERAQTFYPQNETIGLTRAISLERIGQSAAAEKVLRRFDQSNRTDLIRARTQLLLRIGDVSALVSLTKRALAAATDHEERFHYQRTLATLYSRVDRTQYLESAWRLGEVSKQDVEDEEGAFLLHFLMATAGEGLEVSHARLAEFQERLKRFTDRFPKSSILKIGNIRDDASPEELLDQLNGLAGFTEARTKAQQKARLLGERIGSQIPMAFRPRTFAPYASNIVDLLRITVNAWHQGESSKIIVGDVLFPLTPPSAPPIIDLVTMLLLVELGLFDKLFTVWTAIAIPKESFEQLADLMFGPHDFGSSDLIDKVLEALRRHHSTILQPGAPLGADAQYPHNELATIKHEVAAKRFEYLTFDLASAAMLVRDEHIAARCRSVWDFLQTALERGGVSNALVSLTRLRVASWNAKGVPLDAADIVSASLGIAGSPEIQEDAPAGRSARSFIAAHQGQQAFKNVAKVLVELAKTADANSSEAAYWFARIFYTEALLARSIGFNSTTDELTAQLAVVAVIELRGHQNAHANMEFIWRVLEKGRTDFGGSMDRDKFFRLVGKRAAVLFDRIAKKHGLQAMYAEAEFTDLLFALGTPGTQDRAVLESAYFEETLSLQS